MTIFPTLYIYIHIHIPPLALSVSDQVLVGDLPPHMSAMEHMSRVATEIYLPMVTNPKLKGVWSDMIIKDVVDGFNGFISNVQIIQGQVEGATRLPLPPDSAVLEIQEPNMTFEDRVFIDTQGEEAMANMDRVYVLEGAIITWTKQIKVYCLLACFVCFVFFFMNYYMTKVVSFCYMYISSFSCVCVCFFFFFFCCFLDIHMHTNLFASVRCVISINKPIIKTLQIIFLKKRLCWVVIPRTC
jgi:hypothetical protein